MMLDVLQGCPPVVRNEIQLLVPGEDVHWADPSTLNLLEYVLTPGAGTTIPLIATWRTGSRPRRPPPAA
jgi:hypothetical protein